MGVGVAVGVDVGVGDGAGVIESLSVAELLPGTGSVTPPGAATVAVLLSVPLAPAEIFALAV